MTDRPLAELRFIAERGLAHIRATRPPDGVYLTETPALTVRRPCGRGHVQVAGTRECAGCRLINNQKRRKGTT